MELFPAPDDTIEGVSQALRTGRTTCAEVTRACLAAIDAREHEIHAWADLDRDGAMIQAEELDLDLAQRHWHGFLHGIPLGIKDIIDVAGIPTRAGASFTDGRPARSDATVVARLRAAGAVILGKTATTQFACFDPAETRNPWSLDRTPGGSSSGSAAALASGMCLGALGTQTGGSITRPAAYCGIAGCKPTFRHVSSYGVWPLAFSLDHPGPMARTVADLAILLDVIAGYDRRDPRSAREPPPAVLSALEEDTLRPPALGRLRGPFEERADAAVRESFEHALDVFRRSGGRVVEISLPGAFEGLSNCHRTIMAVEAAESHAERFEQHRDAYRPSVRALVEEGLSIRGIDYVRCRHHQAELRREMRLVMDEAEVLVCPAVPGPAPDLSTTGDPVFNVPWSYVGFPTVSFPMGLSAEGLPLGLQLVGREFGEAALFRGAAWCERELRRRYGW
ncbi:MAG TPA: amidase [Planctomycetaceae bacterium]|nr:amidase [Planctomycetaceae bacterium]